MIRALTLTAAAGALAAGSLSTDYSSERSLKIEASTAIAIETTEFSMERDGEPVDSNWGGGGGNSTTYELVQVDTLLEGGDGAPAKVRRSFETVSGEFSMTMRDEELEMSSDSPFDGLVIELVDVDGEVEVEVVEGSEPDEDEALEGHSLRLALDALLPDDDVEAGDTWDLEADAVKRALGFDVSDKLFPRPTPEGMGGGRRGEGGGGGGRRGGGRRGGGGLPIDDMEWTARATLDSIDEETASVTVEIGAIGTLPEREWGGRRDREVAFGLTAAPERVENTYVVELEGTLEFSVAEQRPLSFEIEGNVTLESHTERNWNESTMVIHSVREGTIAHKVRVTTVEVEESEE